MNASTKLKTRRDVYRLAEQLGATVEINSEAPDLDVGVMAPGWHHWREDPHELIGCQNDSETAREVWTDLWERMAAGVEPCSPETCQCWGAGTDPDPTKSRDDCCGWWGPQPEEGGAA